MKRKKMLMYGVILAIISFALAIILFNDVSFNLIGFGIIILGISIIIYMNQKE